MADSIDPCTGAKLAESVEATREDVDSAVAAATGALPAWKALPGHARARFLYAIARGLQKHAKLLSVLEALDNGKTIRETRDLDVPLAIRHFYHHAGWAQVYLRWGQRLSGSRFRFIRDTVEQLDWGKVMGVGVGVEGFGLRWGPGRVACHSPLLPPCWAQVYLRLGLLRLLGSKLRCITSKVEQLPFATFITALAGPRLAGDFGFSVDGFMVQGLRLGVWGFVCRGKG